MLKQFIVPLVPKEWLEKYGAFAAKWVGRLASEDGRAYSHCLRLAVLAHPVGSGSRLASSG